MSRHTTTRRKKAPQAPSKFFIVAILIGVILLFWLVTMAINRPIQTPATSTAAPAPTQT